VIEAFAYAMDRSTDAGARSPSRPARQASGDDRGNLSEPVHRDDPGHGCAVPTLGAEIARESAKTRKAFAAKLEQMIDIMADQILDVPRKAARKQAMATLATMMGRWCCPHRRFGEFSDEILGAGREAVLMRGRQRNRPPGRVPPRRGTNARLPIGNCLRIVRMPGMRSGAGVFAKPPRVEAFPNV